MLTKVTAHVAKHTYCTNWIADHGESENSMERLSRQVGTSVAVLRRTYVHVEFSEADWEHIRNSAPAPDEHGLMAQRQRPHVRIVPGAWLDRAVFARVGSP
jgi:hypothetical protein